MNLEILKLTCFVNFNIINKNKKLAAASTIFSHFVLSELRRSII
jgi:hypothetical protein